MSAVEYICMVVASIVPELASRERHSNARSRRRREDLWVGTTALIAAMLALPFAQTSWHGPEVAASLAVAATAMLAGQRWAIGFVAIAELLLAPKLAMDAYRGCC